jgi:hypothetical protein
MYNIYDDDSLKEFCPVWYAQHESRRQAIGRRQSREAERQAKKDKREADKRAKKAERQAIIDKRKRDKRAAKAQEEYIRYQMAYRRKNAEYFRRYGREYYSAKCRRTRTEGKPTN